MKLLILATIVTCLVTGVALGQNSKQSNSLDQRIRKLEQEESDAVLHSDVAALEKLPTPSLIVEEIPPKASVALLAA